MVFDVLFQSRRDRRAAKRLLRKRLKRQGRTPHVLTTGTLPSDGAAQREVMPGIAHRQHKGLDDRAETPHQPTRRRERRRRRFRSLRHARRALSAHEQIANLFHLRRDHVAAGEHRAARLHAFKVWVDMSGVVAAA